MSAETEVLKTQANIIKNEVDDGKNTANRVGTALLQAATAIEKEKVYCDDKFATEKLRAESAESDLSTEITNKIATEKSRAQSVESALSNRIEQVDDYADTKADKTELTAEETRAKGVEATLNSQVTSLSQKVGNFKLQSVENDVAYQTMINNGTIDNNTIYFVKE